MNNKQYLPISDDISEYEYITDQSICLNEKMFIKQILFFNSIKFANASQSIRIFNEINEFI